MTAQPKYFGTQDTLDLLGRLEWSDVYSYKGMGFCLECRHWKKSGHSPDCQLDAALRTVNWWLTLEHLDTVKGQRTSPDEVIHRIAERHPEAFRDGD